MHHIISHKKLTISQVSELMAPGVHLSLGSEAEAAIIKCREYLDRENFGERASVFFVFNGTGANTLCIDAMCRSHEAVVCAESAHVNVDECGSVQRVVGCRLLERGVR